MTRVITYGTFDVLHIGHINILKRARELGDQLFVGLSSDEFNTEKNKKSVQDYDNRNAVLNAVRYVDFVFKEDCWEQKIGDIRKYQADIFVMGDDWSGRFDFLKKYCDVIYVPRTPDISTTILKKRALEISTPI